MKIFVTGGAGFIGGYLIEQLVKEHIIRIYDNITNSSEEKISKLINKGIDFVKGDILDYENMLNASKNYDIIIHLAAQSDVAESILNPKKTFQINVDGTENVLKCCKENKIKRIIFASSAAVYGNCKELPITEEANTIPLSPYGQSKLDAENKIIEFTKKTGIDAICLRLFNVYGKDQNEQYAGAITKFLNNIKREEEIIIYGDGEQTRDFIAINDIVYAFELAIKHNLKHNVYNIASGNEISINELIKIIGEVYSKKFKVKHEAERNGDIKNSFPSIGLIKNEIGFYPKIKLKDGLKKIVN